MRKEGEKVEGGREGKRGGWVKKEGDETGKKEVCMEEGGKRKVIELRGRGSVNGGREKRGR